MSASRLQQQQVQHERAMGVGMPHPVPSRSMRDMNVAAERMEDDCGKLPDLYMRKFKILERLQAERPAYPFATNVRQGTNKPVFIQHTLWDKVLKEVYWRATDFQEEKKAKTAQAFHLAKKMKKNMSKRFLIRDELHFFHKLICFQISSDVEQFFSQVKVLTGKGSNVPIAQTYKPPHEVLAIKAQETEARQQKELEEQQKKRDLEIEREQDQFVDQFFTDENNNDGLNANGNGNMHGNSSNMNEENCLSGNLNIKSHSTQNNTKIEDEGQGNNSDQHVQDEKKQLKPFARFAKQIMEINPDSFDTPEMKIMSEFRDNQRKKDILDKLRDTIIKYGGKRKERSNIDIIFNMILPSSQPLEGAAPAAGGGQLKLEGSGVGLLKLEGGQQNQQHQQDQLEHSQSGFGQQEEKDEEDDDEIKVEGNIKDVKELIKYEHPEEKKEEGEKQQQSNNNGRQIVIPSVEDLAQEEQNKEVVQVEKKEEDGQQNEMSEQQNKEQVKIPLDSINRPENAENQQEENQELIGQEKEEKQPLDEEQGHKQQEQEIKSQDQQQQSQPETKEEHVDGQQQTNLTGSEPIELEEDAVKIEDINAENKRKEQGSHSDSQHVQIEVKEEQEDEESKQQQDQNNQLQENNNQIVDGVVSTNGIAAEEKSKELISQGEDDVMQLESKGDQKAHANEAVKEIQNIAGDSFSELPQSQQQQNLEEEIGNNSQQQPQIQQQSVPSMTPEEQAYMRQRLSLMCQQLDQSACSIMSVEGTKKKKRRDDTQKETLNEDFLSHIKILNPHFDPKKIRHENLNELLMFNYNKNGLPGEFDKIFEKTINNYSDFPKDFGLIPRVQEVGEDEIEMSGQALYDLPYETFCYTHGSDIDRFLKKVSRNIQLMANQERLNQVVSSQPFKDLLQLEEVFKSWSPIGRKDNNLYAVYSQRDSKVVTRVLSEQDIIQAEKYRSLAMITQSPIFFFYFEYYQAVWGNKPHLISNSLNSNPITKHYFFTQKIVEKLDWILRIRKQEKFVYITENILPTMYQFIGDNTQVNEDYIEQSKKRKIEEEHLNNDKSTFINDEDAFEKAVEQRQSQPKNFVSKPSTQVFRNMNKCFSNYFSSSHIQDLGKGKYEYRKGILEYAKAIKKTQFPIETREEDKGKTIDYSSFTKMVKVEDVKQLIIQSRTNPFGLNSSSSQPKFTSRKKVIIEQSNELLSVISHLKNVLPSQSSQQSQQAVQQQQQQQQPGQSQPQPGQSSQSQMQQQSSSQGSSAMMQQQQQQMVQGKTNMGEMINTYRGPPQGLGPAGMQRQPMPMIRQNSNIPPNPAQQQQQQQYSHPYPQQPPMQSNGNPNSLAQQHQQQQQLQQQSSQRSQQPQYDAQGVPIHPQNMNMQSMMMQQRQMPPHGMQPGQVQQQQQQLPSQPMERGIPGAPQLHHSSSQQPPPYIPQGQQQQQSQQGVMQQGPQTPHHHHHPSMQGPGNMQQGPPPYHQPPYKQQLPLQSQQQQIPGNYPPNMQGHMSQQQLQQQQQSGLLQQQPPQSPQVNAQLPPSSQQLALTPQASMSQHEPLPINKKIKKGDDPSPLKKPPTKKNAAATAAAAAGAGENESEKKKKPPKKKKGAEEAAANP